MSIQNVSSVELSFENSLHLLEEAIRKLEQGDLLLEEALNVFEESVRYSRECHQFLEKAEQRIEMILKNKKGEYESQDFVFTK